MPENSHPKIDLNRVTASKKTRTVKKVRSLQDELDTRHSRWQAKENPHSFLTVAQKKALMGVVPDPEFTQEVRSVTPAAAATAAAAVGFLPSFDPQVDWRTKDGGKVTPVKDQGTCGSCVSFGTVAMMESMALIECNASLDLSEADLHFCSGHGANCGGWYPSQAIRAVQERGVTDEAHFPYASAFSGGEPHCIVSPERDRHLYNFNTSQWTIFDSFRKDYLTHHGPMIACMIVYDDFFSYGGGVYQHVTGQRTGTHCILVIGYSQAERCWICKNSWGTEWGEDGFFKIAYGACSIDSIRSPFFGVQGMILP